VREGGEHVTMCVDSLIAMGGVLDRHIVPNTVGRRARPAKTASGLLGPCRRVGGRSQMAAVGLPFALFESQTHA